MRAEDTAWAGGKMPHDGLSTLESAIMHVALALTYLDEGNVAAVRSCLTDAQAELGELADEQ